MKKVIIYPGRFQPMLSHHAEVLRQLQAQFPDADVYVGTSDKVDGEKSPFNFAEKQQIAQAHGIKPERVLLVKRPYHKDDYPFDQENTVIIFAVGEKDLNRFPFSNTDPESGLDMTVRGEPKPKYYQPIDTMQSGVLPMSERGYITLTPTIRTGNEVASASQFRQQLKDAPDKEAAKQLFTKQFGEYNETVFNIIYNKIVGTNMSESINILRQLAGLPVQESAPVDFSGDQPKSSISKEEQALAEIGRFVMDIAKDLADPEASNEVAQFGMALTSGDITTHSDLINAIKGAGEHGKALSDAVKSAMADMAAGKTVRHADSDAKEPDYAKAKADYKSQTEQVDLSDFYAEEAVSEDADDQQSKFLAAVEDFVQSAQEVSYGEVHDIEQAYELFQSGNLHGAIDVIASGFSDQDGGEVAGLDPFLDDLESDLQDIAGGVQEAEKPDFLDLDKDGDTEESMKDAAEDAEEEVGSHPCHVCGNMSYADGTCSDRTCSNFDQPVEIDETVEATAGRALDSAMAELRKLAGL